VLSCVSHGDARLSACAATGALATERDMSINANTKWIGSRMIIAAKEFRAGNMKTGKSQIESVLNYLLIRARIAAPTIG
jgi:hypothetical protein